VKPLNEWTDEEIVEWLDIDAGGGRRAALAELLRRERDRCAAACREVVQERRSYDFPTHKFFWSEAAGAEECEHRIARLS